MKSIEQLEPTIFIVFGGVGDLTWRKLMPSLFDLYQDSSMPAIYSIIIVDRVDISLEKLLQHYYEGIKEFARNGNAKIEVWNEFAKQITYQKGDFKKLDTYTALADDCLKLEKGWGVKAGRIFYMATPPSMFGEIPNFLGQAGLSQDTEKARLVIEKPIGYDLQSACALNAVLAANFQESQIFRIDHYLGKETVQNILAFRFANPLFEPIWNRRYIEYVTITAAESVGVENRGGYYDHAGALRDMVQNHLMQLLCLVGMEPMVSFVPDEIRNKKVDVLHAVRRIHEDDVAHCVVRGQYGPGWVEGQKVPGYREEESVSPDSQTETFVALKLFIDNWRWQGVPFYLRTGKRLTRQDTEIMIQFREVPHQCFPVEANFDRHAARLVISIQPEEGITMRFQAKAPGSKMLLRSVDMQFNYQDAFAVKSHEAYETLLWDIMKNDATLFMRSDQIEAAWKILMPILDLWKKSPSGDFPNYAAGTWGPEAVQGLLAEGQYWPLPLEFEVAKL